MKSFFSSAAACAVTFFACTVALAQFSATNAGPITSDGPIGTATNGFFTATYGGPTTLFGNVDFSGSITSGGVGSWQSEARWNVKNITSSANASFQFSTTTGSFTGPNNIVASRSTFFWLQSGQQYRFEAFESFNDTGADATWTNIDFNFNSAPVLTNLGTFVDTTPFTFDTFTSSFDTELALYTATGTKLFENDDFGGLQSEITAGTLAPGQYYLLAGGFNSVFGNEIAAAGVAAGTLNVQLNGGNIFGGVHAANTFTGFSFNVVAVPEPSAIALLGFGVVGLVVRRRRQR